MKESLIKRVTFLIGALVLAAAQTIAYYGGTVSVASGYTLEVVSLSTSALTITYLGRGVDYDAFTLPAESPAMVGTKIPRGTIRMIFELDPAQFGSSTLKVIAEGNRHEIDCGLGSTSGDNVCRLVLDVIP